MEMQFGPMSISLLVILAWPLLTLLAVTNHSWAHQVKFSWPMVKSIITDLYVLSTQLSLGKLKATLK